MDNPFYTIATWLVPLVVAIVLHEIAHGWVANMLGDRTAADARRLSLNPVRHVDPVGTLLLPMFLAVVHAPVFGWARPVPVDGRRLRNPRIDMVLVSLAGPMSNLFLGVLAVGALALTIPAGGIDALDGWMLFLADNLINFLWINIFLAVFNMLPIYPFDGGHVVEGLLPRELAAQYKQLERFGFLIMMLLIVVLPSLSPQLNLIGRIVAPLARAIAIALLGSVVPGI